jgi:hypothetical protein
MEKSKTNQRTLILIAALSCAALAAGCSSGSSGSGSPSSQHSFSEASTTLSVGTKAITAGCSNIVTATPASGTKAWSMISGTGDPYTYSITLDGYEDSGISVSGTITETIYSTSHNFTFSGTLNFSGTGVAITKLEYDNITTTYTSYPNTYTQSGKYKIYFTDGTTWVYDFSNNSFTSS